MGSIAVLGSANADLVVRQPRRPDPGETILGSSFSTGPGGKGLNQAVAAGRAGADVSFLGAVGRDDFGPRLRRTLQDAGVDTARLRDVDGMTGIAQISITDDAENTIVIVPGANADTSFDDGDRAVVAAASHLVVQLERPHALVAEALAFARANGVATVLTPAPAVRGIEALLGLADILIPNETEATLLTGETDAEAAACALSEQSGIVVLTRGSRGAVVAIGGRIRHRVAARLVDAKDTTGAGDAFAGVLVTWLAEGRALDVALDAATAAASLSVGREGAAASLPTRSEIDAVLAAG